MEERLKRGYKNPVNEIEDMGINPFMVNFKIPINKRFTKVTNKFGVEDELEHTWDAGKCCKIFEYSGDREEIVKLSIRSKEMLLYIIQSIKSGEDFIWIDKVSYMQNMDIKSVNTFKSAIKPLLNKFLAPQGTKDVYWVNPARIFRGSRINKFPNKFDIKNTTIK